MEMCKGCQYAGRKNCTQKTNPDCADCVPDVPTLSQWEPHDRLWEESDVRTID